jgi:hypothetical protein
MYAPLDKFSAEANPPAGEAGFVLSRTGTFCRVKASATGLLLCSIATFHASTVSFASAGLITITFGIARSEAKCSIG